MDTDYGVPGEVDRIQARVSKMMDTGAGLEEVETWRNTFPVSDDALGQPGLYELPATFGVLPGESDVNEAIVIELQALGSGTDQTLVSRRVTTGFVAGETRLIRMALYRACAEMVCPERETCGCPGAAACAEPSCVSAIVNPEELEPVSNPGVLPEDAGIPIPDAGVPDGSVPDGGVISCEPPLTLCGMNCVNPQGDPRYCGDCETACPRGYVCEAGSCIDPGDCRMNGAGCSGFTYCDEDTGDCLPGCVEAQQCNGAHEVCDNDLHECVCASDFERCDGICVNTQIDPSYCGECTLSCPQGQICVAGMCGDPGDCRTNAVGCGGFTYCDEATGECLRGCEADEQCVGGNEECDTVLHECVCEPGFHLCGAVCVDDLDVSSCGGLCTPCSAPPNASPICDLGTCDFVCDETYVACGQLCCPTSCPPGQALYNGSCAEVHLQTVDETGTVGEFSSLALDVAGRAHIAYYANSGRDLGYSAQQVDDSWISQRPDGKDEVGKHSSIAVDPEGVLHIAYYNASQKNLMLATNWFAAIWTVQTVDDTDDVGEYASLAFDAAGDPHISYYDRNNKDLMYATRQGVGPWAIEAVDFEDDVGEHTSLALSPSGAVHISYYDSGGKDLKHASQTSDGSWRTQTVDSVGDVGKYTSLAFDPTGVPHISYYADTGRNLRFASADDMGAWTSQSVDSVGDVGKFTSLAFDARGGARISYYYESGRDLRHALGLPGETWVLRTVDSVGDVGRYTSIAVDGLGQAHISYYDVTNSDLKYAIIAAPE